MTETEAEIALLRACDVDNIPLATHPAAAEAVVEHLKATVRSQGS